MRCVSLSTDANRKAASAIADPANKWRDCAARCVILYLGRMEAKDPNEEPLSNDPDEALRLENELIKLKMQAELGAQFGGNLDDLSPEIEHQFLQQMLAFEAQLATEPTTTLEEHLGRPDFTAAEALPTEAALDAAWQALRRLLEEKSIRVEFIAKDYPTRVRYDFVVRELFPQKIHPPMAEGQYLVFTYEDAHPDHFAEMDQRVHELFHAITHNEIHPSPPYLAEALVTPGGLTLKQSAFGEKVQAFHEQFAAVSPFQYDFTERSREAADQELPDSDLGFVEGRLRYEVTHHDGSKQELKGPFKVYLQYQYGWWEVFSFELYGFSWA
jgi:hypothetical protein